MGNYSNKNSQIKILKPHAHLCIIGRKSTKFQMNPMKDVAGVEETRFLTYKAYVSMGNNSVKNRSIKNPKPHAYLHIIGRKSTYFQMNLMKDVEEVAKTRSWLAKFDSMGDNSIKNSRIKILKPQAHLHIIGRKSTKFQMDPMREK